MSASLKIGVAGLGTVGAGTVELLQKHGDMLSQRAGRKLEVTAVSARDASKDRGVDLSGITWYDDAVALAGDKDIDVVVELIGGEDGIAKALTDASIDNGKHVVTANKAMIAHHGTALAEAAEAHALMERAGHAGKIVLTT